VNVAEHPGNLSAMAANAKGAVIDVKLIVTSENPNFFKV
jgi:hypothetical protein